MIEFKLTKVIAKHLRITPEDLTAPAPGTKQWICKTCDHTLIVHIFMVCTAVNYSVTMHVYIERTGYVLCWPLLELSPGIWDTGAS